MNLLIFRNNLNHSQNNFYNSFSIGHNKYEDHQSKISGYNLRRKNFNNDNNYDDNHKATLENFKELLDNMDNKIYGGGHLNTQQSQQNQFQNSQGFNKMNKNEVKYRTINAEH